MPIVNITGGNFQGPSGGPVANGTIEFKLGQAAKALSSNLQLLSAPITYSLDSSGNIVAGATLWPCDDLTPQGDYYIVKIRNSNGALVRGPENWAISGASPIDLGGMIMSSTTLAFVGAVLLNPNEDQSILAHNLSPAVGNPGEQSLGTEAAPWDASLNDVAIAGAETITGTVTQTNAGKFFVHTDSQYSKIQINGATNSFNTIGAGGGLDASAVAIDVPLNTTLTQVNGFAAYVTSNADSASRTKANAVGFYAVAQGSEPGASMWGSNVVIGDSGVINAPVDDCNFVGYECDLGCAVSSPAYAVSFLSASDWGVDATIPEDSSHFTASAVNANSAMTYGLQVGRGASSTAGLWLDGTATSGDCDSQKIIFVSYSSGLQTNASIKFDAAKNLTISPNGGAVNLAGNTTINAKITSYNGTATAGNGIASEVFQVLSCGLTANYNAGSAKTLFTPAAPGQWRVSFSEAITQAATSSSTLPSLALAWTDAGGISRTKTLVATSTANTTATESDGVAVIYTNGSTAVTVTSASYASSGGTVMQYDLSVTAEKL